MNRALHSANLPRMLIVAFATVLITAGSWPVWADDSSDLLEQISQLTREAGANEAQASQAESSGDNAGACTAYRDAARAWRDAARAGTSLIVASMSDHSLDADTVEKNVDIMANNSSIDDEHADAVCN